MNYQIRKIEETDYPCLIKLFQEFATFEKLPEKMTNTVEAMLEETELIKGFVVCNEENKIIAYVTCFLAYYTWTGKSMYLEDLYVTTANRGKGIGTLLINKVIELAKTEKCKKLKWQVSRWNKPAVDFYKSLGAEITSIESNCDLMLNA